MAGLFNNVVIRIFSVLIALLAVPQTCLGLSIRQAPVTNSSTQVPPECVSLSADFSPQCAKVLSLDKFLLAWYANTAKCTSQQDVSTCCKADEKWSNCFLRLAMSVSDLNCYDIDSCSYLESPLKVDASATKKWWSAEPGIQGTAGTAVAPLGTSDGSILLSYRYVIHNIYAANFFFTTWYHSLTEAFSAASDTIASISQLVDADQKASIVLNDITLSLTYGLAYASSPELTGIADPGVQAVGALLAEMVHQAPSIAKILWPTGVVDPTVLKISEISQNPYVTQRVGDTLNTGLHAVQSGINEFINFTLLGTSSPFSVPKDKMPTLSSNTEGLLTAFTTFLVSSGLVANGWNAAIAAGTNPLKLSTNASATIPDWALYKCPDCQAQPKNMGCTAYDANNQCGRWWYSENFRSAFTLTGQPGQDPGNTISQILTNKWSTGPLLFENSSICDAFSSLQADDPKMTLESTGNIGDAIGRLTGNVQVFDTSKTDFAFLWKNFADLTVRGDSLMGVSTDDGVTATTDFAKPDTTLKHPGNTLQVYTRGGIEFSCTSQLSTSLLGDWILLLNGTI